MLVRKLDPTTDGPGALAVLQEGIREQSLSAKTTEGDRQAYQRDQVTKAYDEVAGCFRAPETWSVAVDEGQIIGVLQIMAETDPREERYYRSHGFLLIQELDAFPQGRRAGTKLLGAVKQEAVRRGRTAIVLQTPTKSNARKWYRAHGFRSWPGGNLRPTMSGMILRLDGGRGSGA